MKLGYFARPIGRTGGIPRYTHQLLLAMQQISPDDEWLLYSNLTSPELAQIRGRLRSGPRRIGRVGWEQFWLPIQLAKDKPDVYHSADFTLPLACRTPSVVTVHDLIFVKQKAGTSWQARALYKTLTGASVRKAKRVFSVSRHSATEVMRYFRIPEDKMEIIYPGAPKNLPGLADGHDLDTVVSSVGAIEPFALYVGLVTPRKGVLTLIKAFSEAYAMGKVKSLVLAGLTDAVFGQVKQAIEQSGVSERIILAGSVDDLTLAALFRRASVFCFASYHEGFGLPVVEAMMMGCPVITSNETSLPEVVGEAGMLLPPDDISAWAAAIHKVSSDSGEAERMVELGRKQSEKFTYEAAAQKTLQIYNQVASGQ